MKQVISRGRATTIADNTYLKWLCLQNHHASALHSKVELENTYGVDINARTVQRQLTKCRLLAYCPKKKPLLTHKMKKSNLLVGKKKKKTCSTDESLMGHCNFLE